MSKTEVLTARIVGQDDLSRPLKTASDSLNKFQGTVNQSTRGFRLMRGGMAQLGMQVQDVAVQLQGGTAAMTVFAQQGSQIASLFGAKGAIIGAVLAVGAALSTTLIPKLLNSTSSMDKLQKKMEDLSKVMKMDLAENTFSLSKEFRDLAAVSEDLAKVQLTLNLIKANKLVAESFKSVSEAAEDLRVSISPNPLGNINVFEKAAKRIGVTKDQMVALDKAAREVGKGTKGSVDELSKLLQTIFTAGQGTKEFKDKFLKLVETIISGNLVHAEATRQVTALREALAGLPEVLENTSKKTKDTQKAQEEFLKNLRQQIAAVGKTKEEIARLGLTTEATELFGGVEGEVETLINRLLDAQSKVAAGADFEKLRSSLLTQEQALSESYARQNDIIDAALAEEVISTQEAANQKIVAERKYHEDAEKLRLKSKKWESKTAQEKTEFVLGELSSQFSGIATNNKKLFNLNKKLQIAQAVMETYRGASKALSFYPPPLSFAMAAAQVAAGLGNVAQIKSQSFEGGGFTGSGSRSGGIDGRGGFAAILHPNESVIDHTKQNAGGVTIINNVDATGGGPDVDLKIQQAMAVTSQQTVATVKDLMSRGRF